MNWQNLVPDHIAKRQDAFDRGRKIIAMRRAGLKWGDIARRFSCSETNVKRIEAKYIWRATQTELSPVEIYLQGEEPRVDEPKRTSLLSRDRARKASKILDGFVLRETCPEFFYYGA